jgi:hypothetical protein
MNGGPLDDPSRALIARIRLGKNRASISAPVLGASDPEQDVLAKANLDDFAFGVSIQEFARLAERTSIRRRHHGFEARRGLIIDQIEDVGFEQGGTPSTSLGEGALWSLIQINSPCA